MPHQVTGVEIDPRNQVLDGVDDTKKSTGEDPETFFMSPNPNRGTFSFRINDNEGLGQEVPVKLEIFSSSGQLVHRASYEACLPFMDYQVNMENPVRGLYYARFSCGSSIEILKVLVE
jgi:hypothetical protein